MNILENILIILELQPAGTLSASEVNARVTERLTNPKRLADEMRAAPQTWLVPTETTTQPEGIFGELIDERDGVWAITEAGRSYLQTLGIRRQGDHL